MNSLRFNYRRRPECTCYRHQLPPLDFNLILNLTENQTFLCSDYATRRGPHQRIISISLYGPKENKRFQYNQSLFFLNELINDINIIYPDDFTLRIHHDDTITLTDVICPIECQNPNVDFCSMNSKLFIPPKVWRFIPAGDPLVDIMMSRDLDSALTQRERAAVNAWLASNKSFHTMRDHPYHAVPMLGGMWGFRPSLNPTISRLIHNKIHDRNLIKRYHGINDQTFLSREVWPQANSNVIAHDSFLCKKSYGKNSEPFPTQRPSANETNCFIGCPRPCCGDGKIPFGECPKECRPKDHPEWNYC
ncbi:unnamed protein product [Rotaria sordida]|uniref:Uncharacterized protein n=3 Tax=Rotaria sordida TaxID=392033 RepID=A0A814C4D5_9BILA|nr:unnamed protein product [Rotaria sordida]